MLYIPVQPEKAEAPIFVTPLGMDSDDSPLHPEKAPVPILVTLFGIVILFRYLHPEKAAASISVIFPVITTSVSVVGIMEASPKINENLPPSSKLLPIKGSVILVRLAHESKVNWWVSRAWLV